IGNGLFKPSISTLLGNLYSEEDYKALKDSGYSIFYMGINIGALICNFIAAFMRNKFGWGAAFASAGIGMFIGLIVFTTGLKYLRDANVMKPAEKEDVGVGKVLSYVFLPAILFGALGWFIPGNLLGSDSTDAFICACIPVIVFYVSLYVRANQNDKRPIAALLAIFAVSVMFWAVFKQNGTALTRWANYYTDRSVAPAIEKPLGELYLAEEKIFAKDSVTVYDDQFRAQKDEAGQPLKEYGYDVYFKNVPEGETPPENGKIYLLNTELFQSVNPAWVIILTPVLVGVFAFLRKRKKEPTTA